MMADEGPAWCLPHPPDAHPVPRDGRRHCGVLEQVLRRQWDPASGLPPAEVIAAVDRLASLPVHIASRLAAGLEGIWVGSGPVSGLDHLQHLRGVPVSPGARHTWDIVPGAVVGRVMAIGTGDHVSVSLIDHEVGHALEVLDDMAGRPDWQAIMRRSRPLLVIDRYQDAREWWAEAWALCALVANEIPVVQPMHREILPVQGQVLAPSIHISVSSGLCHQGKVTDWQPENAAAVTAPEPVVSETVLAHGSPPRSARPEN